MDHPIVIVKWTGRHATALKLALRMSTEEFAQRLGVGPRSVAEWSREPDLVPKPVMQQALDTLLSQSDDAAQTRFELLVYGRSSHADATPGTTAADLTTAGLLDWVDLHAGWQAGTARLQVHDLLAQMTPLVVRRKAAQRGRVARSSIAAAISALYPAPRGGHNLYAGRCGTATAATSILTCPEWTEMSVPLGTGHDSLTPTSGPSTPMLNLDETAAAAAVQRIAESINLQTRMFDAELYCLTHVDISQHGISGRLRLANFADYALTFDLLENELIDALLNAGSDVRWSQLPLRKLYLGSIDQAISLNHRLCAGGPLALLAIARPPTRSHGPDYAIVVQQRSAQVLNGVGRLAVIPKAFHQPLFDFSDDAQLSATLERELEEELLGRDELQPARGPAQRLVPLHHTRLSQPMRWLVERADSDAWRAECTGFGLNLVNGNYEFASLITIDDEEWWNSFGGQLVTNWEAESIRIYSSLDIDRISQLTTDEHWSDEGLFAFLQGIRRLAVTGGQRVNLPPTELEHGP
ncbi:hypothetical protein [Mycolicibacter icosiumassiliensis]|uniref:hypothetical protein n=1 Tax=Mycolicibacter icosiumassiliensis TaxID=1792835 RepID=UPI00082A86C1|nr:hypothetical protein [Mycolicibacter icosiumassiliensis]